MQKRGITLQGILLGLEPRSENLLVAAKEISAVFGFLDSSAISALASYFSLTEAEVFEAVSPYSQIKTKGFSIEIGICDSPNCALKRADEIISQVENFFKQRVDDEFNPKVKISRESCQGMCASGPIMTINGTFFEKVSPEDVDQILSRYV